MKAALARDRFAIVRRSLAWIGVAAWAALAHSGHAAGQQQNPAQPRVPVRNLAAPRVQGQPPGAGQPVRMQPGTAPQRVAPAGGVPALRAPAQAQQQLPRTGAVQPAQAVAPARGPAAGARPGAPQPPQQQQPAHVPFRLTAEQQQQLDQVLLDWQQQSQAIKSFTCTLTRWEFDPVFNKKVVGVGDLKYRAPDHGLYRVKNKETGDWIEHWVCDGESIYEYNYTKKELIQRVLPQEMRGKAIADGPLPFIFGADAAKLKQRYWMRLIQPPPQHQDKICLEAWPRTQLDAANFRRAELLLSSSDMLPFALQIDLTNGKSYTVHRFDQIVTNDPLRGLKDIFTAPRAYPGWTKIVDDGQTVEPEGGRELPAEQARSATPQPR